eukprot:Phypoly_transcript_00430.p2 GENE.Phypoly_transcript_00430~~Phypoly_transcript_00430.p2  ORF type:complete len:647 (-),score=156.84 Phypoly_transcript_00430:69-2009(-)
MELETEYDVIVLGTGFVESVIAGAAARQGKKVLHLDHNDFYGGYASSNHLSGFEKQITSVTEGITPQPEKWPSQTYTCIPVATNPSPKFANVKVYTYDRPKTTESVEPAPETSNTESAEPNSEEQVAKGDNEGKTEETKESTEIKKEEGKEEEKAEQKEERKEEEKKERKEEKDTPRSKFDTREKVMSYSRQFTIDIIPRLLFSRGEMVNLLISSAVGRYLEFKCLEKTFLLTSNSVQPVPCSKGDIFKSKYITNSERRMLTRFMQLIHNDLTENGKIDKNAFGSFYDFIKAQNLSPNLEMFVLYAISMCTDDQQSSASRVSVAEGLRVLETYVSSVSKYGNTPFLCPMYGISELPQAFCRLCAVYGGVYVLRRSAQCVLVDSQTNQFKGIICSEGETMKGTQFVTTGSYFPHLLGDTPKISRSSRCVAVSSTPVIIPSEGESDNHATLIIIPPLSPVHALNNSHAIHIFQFDFSLSVAPKGKYVLHFCTQASGTAEQDLERAVSYFLNTPQMADAELVADKPYAHWVGYFNLNLHTPATPTSPAFPKNMYVVTEGPTETASIDYKDQLKEAEEVFALMCPDQPFLPKVPNPEDIVWGGANETTQEEPENANNNGNGGEAETTTTTTEHEGEKTEGEEKKNEETSQ